MNYCGSLHNHTEYSNLRLRDAITRIPDLMSRAEELGHSVIAFTDHESLSGWLKIEKEATKHPNLKVIRGNEIYLVRNGLNNENYNREFDRYYHFILLAKDREGARQIMEISTRAWKRSYMARGMRRVPTYYQDLFDIIGANPGHVIGSTACLGGALPTQILRGTDEAKLKIWINQMVSIFGEGNFYLEMQPSRNKDQITVNKRLLKFARELNLPYIITTDTHYLRKEDRPIHKAYLNAQNGDREVDEFYATTYLMNDEEIRSYFDYFSSEEIEEAYHNIERIGAAVSDFSLRKPLKIPELPWREVISYYTEYPTWFERIPMLETFLHSEFESDRYLVNAIIDGIKRHDDLQNKAAYDEINKNLEMTWISSNVNKAQWSAYYLNLQKIIDICWEAGTLVGPGRGSGVGFILLYVLDITQINPLRETTRCFPWRFLNPERVSVLDVDFDIEGSRRAVVLNKFREVYGDDRVANVATFRTEKSKSAILTAARGLGIDVDIAQYISSLIPADRGQLRTLDQCMYGDEENDWAPIKQFVFEMTENYPELWQVAHSIEGLISGVGVHAGGVIFVDEPFTDSTGLMRAPDGTICTQFELHDAEDASLIKYDALSVEAMDKIHNCIDLLCDYGYAERKSTLKETYEGLIGIYKLERKDPKMWQMVWEHKINALFQMEQQSGIKGIATLHPTSVDDLAILNSTIRLMAQEKGGEMPTDKLARFKADPNAWINEMHEHNLTEEDQKILSPVLSMSYGLCIAQEQFMELVQLPELGGFNLTWADKLRKSIAKKNPKDYDALTKEFFKVTQEKGINPHLTDYVWNTLIAMSRGYGFNQSHTLAYSLIALQEMNLAFKYPIMFWNCACLISDAGGNDEDEIDEEVNEELKVEEVYSNEMEEFNEEEDEEESEYDEDEDCDGFPSTVIKTKEGKKKKKVKATNYGKIATAIGKIVQTGVTVAPPDINYSTFTFSPDIEHNSIRYGLSGITRIGEDLIRSIIAARPFTGLFDFIERVKCTKPQIINLIKSGAFDEFGDRMEIMDQYIGYASGAKKEINLRNLKMLIDFGLIPDKYDLQIRVFNFNKYLKTLKSGLDYNLDNIAFGFYEKNFDVDKLSAADTESGFKIKQSTWKTMYDKHMDIIRPYVKAHAAELLQQVNARLKKDLWDKYCTGSLNKWEMDSISYYSNEHELNGFISRFYDVSDFNSLPDEPLIDHVITIKGKQVPLYEIKRIAGTVLDKNKNKKTVTLLTLSGVVTVKIFGSVFAEYDKQLSEKGADGHKHVKEKSWFSRGNIIIVTGIKRDGMFMAKKYSRTPYHLVELVTKVNNDGTLELRSEREEVAAE